MNLSNFQRNSNKNANNENNLILDAHGGAGGNYPGPNAQFVLGK